MKVGGGIMHREEGTWGPNAARRAMGVRWRGEVESLGGGRGEWRAAEVEVGGLLVGVGQG